MMKAIIKNRTMLAIVLAVSVVLGAIGAPIGTAVQEQTIAVAQAAVVESENFLWGGEGEWHRTRSDGQKIVANATNNVPSIKVDGIEYAEYGSPYVASIIFYDDEIYVTTLGGKLMACAPEFKPWEAWTTLGYIKAQTSTTPNNLEVAWSKSGETVMTQAFQRGEINSAFLSNYTFRLVVDAKTKREKALPSREKLLEEFYDYPVATSAPTAEPTQQPTQEPTVEPTSVPTAAPATEAPTQEPTVEPTQAPTEAPTMEPTQEPRSQETVAPAPTSENGSANADADADNNSAAAAAAADNDSSAASAADQSAASSAEEDSSSAAAAEDSTAVSADDSSAAAGAGDFGEANAADADANGIDNQAAAVAGDGDAINQEAEVEASAPASVAQAAEDSNAASVALEGDNNKIDITNINYVVTVIASNAAVAVGDNPAAALAEEGSRADAASAAEQGAISLVSGDDSTADAAVATENGAISQTSGDNSSSEASAAEATVVASDAAVAVGEGNAPSLADNGSSSSAAASTAKDNGTSSAGSAAAEDGNAANETAAEAVTASKAAVSGNGAASLADNGSSSSATAAKADNGGTSSAAAAAAEDGNASAASTAAGGTGTSSTKKATKKVVSWSVQRPAKANKKGIKKVKLVKYVNGKEEGIKCILYFNTKTHSIKFDGKKYKKVKNVGYTDGSNQVVIKHKGGTSKIVARGKGKTGKVWKDRTLKHKVRKFIPRKDGRWCRYTGKNGKTYGLTGKQPIKVK